jgi:ribosomal protein L29
MPVMQYADHHGLRETMYRAYVTRASDLGKPELDNSDIMRRVLELRAEAARLKESLFRLNFKLALGEVDAVKTLRRERRSLARIQTLMRERQQQVSQ